MTVRDTISWWRLIDSLNLPKEIGSLELQITFNLEDSHSVSCTQSVLSMQLFIQHTNSMVILKTLSGYLLTASRGVPDLEVVGGVIDQLPISP